MQKPIHKYLSLWALVSISAMLATDVAPHFSIRSQGFNSVRRVPSQTYHHVHLPGYGDNGCGPAYSSFWLTGEYTRSFRGTKIAKALFGDAINDDHCMKIQGSRVAGRDANALLADYFYLPTDFNSCVCVSPRIQNVILDLNYYVGMDNIWKGLYFAMEAPLTWSKWALNIRENVQNEGVNGFDAGYFSAGAIARSTLNDDFRSFALGNAPGAITQVSNNTTAEKLTTQLQGLQYAKMRKSSTKTTVSELRYYLGWNPVLKDDYHFGFHLEASVPTGNRPHAEWLFEVQNGNNKHTEFGGGLHGHYTFWHSKDEEASWTFEAALDVTHLFKTHQWRTFDLNDKPLSRYMPVLQMTSDITGGLQNAAGAAPSFQFNKFITPLANVSTFDVDVSVGAQVDFIAFFRYEKNKFMCGEGNMTWDFGYNLYSRSCENIELRCGECNQFAENTWALKGDAQVYGYAVSSAPLVTASVPLSATESEATIHGGTNFGLNGVTNAADILTAKQNLKVDNAAPAQSGATVLRTLFANDNTATNPQISSSFDPILIKQSDINFARTKQITHKLFSKWQFTWTEREKWVPYCGCGFEVEFAPSAGCNNSCDEDGSCDTGCNDDCDIDGSCIRAGLSQWGIFANVGISYQ